MSDYYISFIPKQPDYISDTQIIQQIENLKFEKNDVQRTKLEISEITLFAHCGSNLETIFCPFCKSDLMEWWGKAMSEASSDGKSFDNLSIQTPCCNNLSSLNDLEYHFDQGFYKTIFTIIPQAEHHLIAEDISLQLEKISGVLWRIIHTHI